MLTSTLNANSAAAMHEDHPDNHAVSVSTLIELFKQVLADTTAFDHHVSRYLPASQLQEELDLALSADGCKQAEIVASLQSYLRYTPKTWEADFNKLLFSGFDAPGVLADWVTSICNNTMHTYQVAPVATLMEHELIKQLNQLIGFDNGNGIMVSGGSMANTVALLLARHKKCPTIKEQGYSGKPMVAYVSELAHYSFEKAANTLGIGTQNLVAVDSDACGRLKPEALESAIKSSRKEGKVPFFIGLTAGTTVIGSFDPVTETADIARHNGLWLHIDGAWGGPVVFSETHRHLLGDTALANSFTWDAHKLMNVPLTASAILVNDSHSLDQACAGGGSAYLFHRDENEAYNLGNKSLQCGRRVDSLKFWLSWKAAGNLGYAQKVDHLMALSAYMQNRIKDHPQLELLAPANFLNVLFRVVPTGKQSEKQLAVLNISICKAMLSQDLGFVDYASYKGQLGIRYILANEKLTEPHVDRFLEHCLQIGAAHLQL
jgi:glutamate/tyrosine decarboxylase-like PLP-dependent enzyme